MTNTTIGSIGLGNMGSAIMKGLSKNISSKQLFAFDKNPALFDENTCSILNQTNSLKELINSSNIIIIAVKPNIIANVLKETFQFLTNNHLIISIAAGISIETMEEIIGTDKKIIRSMPNTPALVSEGMTVISGNKNINQKDIETAEEIFDSLGKVLVLEEKYLNAVTGMSGCGPAYAFTMIQAMADAGVKLGLPRNESVILAAQTLKGASEMILSGDKDPITLRNQVTSPGGSTIAGVHVLEKSGFSGIIMDTVETAAYKTAELGEKK